MKRSEFLRDYDTISDLMDFCWRNDCDVTENITSADGFNEWINDCLVDWARNYSWDELYSMLSQFNDIEGYDYYQYDDSYGEYRPLDDSDFNDLRDEILEWADDQGDFWDPEDDDEDEEEADCWDQWAEDPDSELGSDDEEFEIPDEEDCSMLDMLSAGVGCIRSINEAALEQARQEDRLFMEFTEIPF